MLTKRVLVSVQLILLATILLQQATLLVCEDTPTQITKPYVKRPQNTKYTVLAAADGGAFAGLITVYVFIELEDAIKRHILLHRPELLPEDSSIATIDDFEISLADFIDCFAGTSAGSWNTLYLASKGGNGASANMLNEKRFIEQYGRIAPGSARGLLIFYNEFVNAMFPQDLVPRPTLLSINTSDPSAPGVVTPLLEPEGGRTILRGWFGNTTLSELSASCFITAFDLVRRTNILFVSDDLVSPARYGFTEVLRRSKPRRREDPFMSDVRAHYGLDFYIKDVSLASSSGPPFFPAIEVSSLDGDESLLVVDGVLYAPSPELPALFHVVNSTGDTSFSRTAVISIGTGTALPQLSDNANGGTLQWDGSGERFNAWITNILSITSAQTEFLFAANPVVKAGQYSRINIFAQSGTELHRDLSGLIYSDLLPELQVIGKQVVEIYTDAIRSFVENFIFA